MKTRPMKNKLSVMKQLGFRDEAPESTKEAYLKHLKNNSNYLNPLPKSIKTRPSVEPEQLSFDFSDENARPLSRKKDVS